VTDYSPDPRHELTDDERKLLTDERWSASFRQQMEAELLQAKAEARAVEEGRRQALDRLRAIGATAMSARSQLDQAVANARGRGATWQQIADELGMQRQSAWKRWHQPGETVES
jgi:hypothetical protein